MLRGSHVAASPKLVMASNILETLILKVDETHEEKLLAMLIFPVEQLGSYRLLLGNFAAVPAALQVADPTCHWHKQSHSDAVCEQS